MPGYEAWPTFRGKWLCCCLLLGSAVCALSQAANTQASDNNVQPPTAANQILYDRYVKVTVPEGWQERRSWELGEDRSLPLYNSSNGAVVFVWGFDRPLYRHGYIESLAAGDRLSRRLEVDLSLWPAEASRYYAMVSGGFMMRTTAHTVTVGPSLKPGEVHYLGKSKAGPAQLEMIEYISDAEVDQAFATKYKMSSELVGSRAQILLGQATFDGGSQGYTVIACRFITKADDRAWLDAVLSHIDPLPRADEEKGLAAEKVRDELSHASAVIQDGRYVPALSQLTAVLQEDPQNDNALMLQGEALLRLHELEDAEKALRQAVYLNQNNDRAHFVLGTLLWEEQKREEALREWELVNRISPLYPNIEQVLLEKQAQHPAAATEQQP